MVEGCPVLALFVVIHPPPAVSRSTASGGEFAQVAPGKACIAGEEEEVAGVVGAACEWEGGEAYEVVAREMYVAARGRGQSIVGEGVDGDKASACCLSEQGFEGGEIEANGAGEQVEGV